MGLGLYFVLLRPPLLPEDLRYIGVSLAEVQVHVPRLLLWLRRVMWVIGGYAMATGLLTIYVAVTTFRAGAKGAASYCCRGHNLHRVDGVRQFHHRLGFQVAHPGLRSSLDPGPGALPCRIE
jgi:hypothetical protein